jgi:hypothetical protein
VLEGCLCGLWCIGRILEFVHGDSGGQKVITSANLPLIVEALLKSILDEPYIAEKVLLASRLS